MCDINGLPRKKMKAQIKDRLLDNGIETYTPLEVDNTGVEIPLFPPISDEHVTVPKKVQVPLQDKASSYVIYNGDINILCDFTPQSVLAVEFSSIKQINEALQKSKTIRDNAKAFGNEKIKGPTRDF